MWQINEIIVSAFSNIAEPNLPKQCYLMDVLDCIKHPPTDLNNRIKQIRNEADKNKRDGLKVKLLPVVCFSGTFSKRYDNEIINLNPIICLDIDRVSDLDAERERLKSVPYVLSIFTSPTGTGLKVLVYHDMDKPEHHKDLYSELGNDLRLMGRTDVKFDMSCSNLSRACFISADPKLWLNKDAIQYHFSPITSPAISSAIPATSTRDIVFPTTLLSDYHKIRQQIQETHTLFEAHYSMYPGCRNKNLYILASFFRYDGIPEDIATDYLVAYYQDNLNGFPAAEIRKTVGSAYK